MDTKRRTLSWAYVSLFIVYLLVLFTDDSLRVPHLALHRFRQDALVPLFFLPAVLIYLQLRRDAEDSRRPIGLSVWLMAALAFAAIGIAAAIELATGATTASALAAPSSIWVLPILVVAIGLRKLWLHHAQ